MLKTAATTLAPTLAVVVSWWLTARTSRKLSGKVEEVHVIVNNQRTEMLAEIAALKARLPATAE